MVEVIILGGKHCSRVTRFEERLIKLADELNIDIRIIKKTSLPEFLTFHTYILPTLLFNNKMIRGRFPKRKELKQLLLEAEQ